MRLSHVTPLLALLLAPFTGCSSLGYHRPVTVEHPRVTLPSGLGYEDALAGVGREALPGTTVTIDYTGWFEDGSEFDSSHDRGIPMTFRLGEAPLAGWNAGIAGMRAGGQRKLYVPADLAYGAEGVPGHVPPNAALVFLIELHEVTEEVVARQGEAEEAETGTAEEEADPEDPDGGKE